MLLWISCLARWHLDIWRLALRLLVRDLHVVVFRCIASYSMHADRSLPIIRVVMQLFGCMHAPYCAVMQHARCMHADRCIAFTRLLCLHAARCIALESLARSCAGVVGTIWNRSSYSRCRHFWISLCRDVSEGFNSWESLLLARATLLVELARDAIVVGSECSVLGISPEM